jgi:hypothetical protein
MVWMLSVLKDPHVKSLGSREVVLGGAVDLLEVEPYGMSLGIWKHALEGNCRTLVSSSSFSTSWLRA